MFIHNTPVRFVNQLKSNGLSRSHPVHMATAAAVTDQQRKIHFLPPAMVGCTAPPHFLVGMKVPSFIHSCTASQWHCRSRTSVDESVLAIADRCSTLHFLLHLQRKSFRSVRSMLAVGTSGCEHARRSITEKTARLSTAKKGKRRKQVMARAASARRGQPALWPCHGHPGACTGIKKAPTARGFLIGGDFRAGQPRTWSPVAAHQAPTNPRTADDGTPMPGGSTFGLKPQIMQSQTPPLNVQFTPSARGTSLGGPSIRMQSLKLNESMGVTRRLGSGWCACIFFWCVCVGPRPVR